MNVAAIELIERYYAAFNRGDTQALLDLLTQDVVHEINQGRREVGRSGFAGFLGRMNQSYRERLVDIVVMATADGKRAAAEFVVLGEYVKTDAGLPPAAGQQYRLPAGAFFDIRAGKIARVTSYYNVQDWLVQVEK